MATPLVPKFQAICPDCGAERWITQQRLCGRLCRSCSRRLSPPNYRHGMYRHRLARIFSGMLGRCGHYGADNPNTKHYADRGIYVCDEWRESRVAFFEWALANGYADDLELDRIDNDGPYSPGNCRWVTHQQNNMNRPPVRSAAKLSKEDVREIRRRREAGETLKQIADVFGVKFQSISKIVNGLQWKDV